MFKHFISASQFTSIDMLEQLFEQANKMEKHWLWNFDPLYLARGRVMASWFAEPSTRTRASFESAWLRMGGTIVSTADAASMSSVVKGESWTDTIKTLSQLSDIIVARTAREGDAENAAAVSSVPFINAGDGAGEHPTQALLDVYTIWKHFGTVNGLTVGLVGDLKHSRTIHSLLKLLGLYKNITYHLVGPERLMIDPRSYLNNSEIHFRTHQSLDKLVDIGPDVIYMTRNQIERHKSIALSDSSYSHKIHHLWAKQADKLPERSIIMHPLPRNQEIQPEVDGNPRAFYFKQVKNGLYIRMALFRELLRENLN